MIKVSIISLLFIFLIHNLLTFLKSTLTVPKIKDLVKTSSDKYQKIFDTLSSKPPNINEENITMHHELNSTFTEIDKLPLYNNENLGNIININENKPNNNNFNIIEQPIISSSMKNELKTFLKNQMNADNVSNSNSNILDGNLDLVSYSNTNNYANY